MINLGLSVKISIIILVLGLTALMYLAGGYAGSMISAYFIVIIMSALLLDQRQAFLSSLLVTIIYVIFFIGELSGIIIPIAIQLEEFQIISYGKAIIDVLSFIIVTLLASVISKSVTDSLNFYRLRSVRLSKIRKRLEFLVKRRTKELRKKSKELQNSNKELKITQKKLEKSLKELQKLDVKKNEFISVASHELKTPLTAIGGYSQLLRNKKILKNAKKRNMFLDIMESESKRLSKMISEMLNISRIEMGAVVYNIEDVNIYDLIKSIENQFASKAEEKRLKYIFKIKKNLPTIQTDKDKLYEIISNLVSNAIKYTVRGKVVVRVSKKNRNIIFNIEDTGIGITRKDYKKIFERFVKIKTSLKDVESTGLGLSIVKEYVEKLGGKIWLKSKVNKGSSFFVKLPIKTKLKIDNRKIRLIKNNQQKTSK